MRILFDQATPGTAARVSEGSHSQDRRAGKWERLQKGDLLNAAEVAGFDLFLTIDKNMRYDQNVTGRKIAIVLISKQQGPDLQPHR